MVDRDKAFNIFLAILIGIPAIVILYVGSTRHMPLNELIITDSP